MKLSKLDPMTALMLVVAFGVVVTMLSQNSVASIDTASVNAKQTVQHAAAELRVTAVQLDEKISEKQLRPVSYDLPIDMKSGAATKLSKATFY